MPRAKGAGQFTPEDIWTKKNGQSWRASKRTPCPYGRPRHHFAISKGPPVRQKGTTVRKRHSAPPSPPSPRVNLNASGTSGPFANSTSQRRSADCRRARAGSTDGSRRSGLSHYPASPKRTTPKPPAPLHHLPGALTLTGEARVAHSKPALHTTGHDTDVGQGQVLRTDHGGQDCRMVRQRHSAPRQSHQPRFITFPAR